MCISPRASGLQAARLAIFPSGIALFLALALSVVAGQETPATGPGEATTEAAKPAELAEPAVPPPATAEPPSSRDFDPRDDIRRSSGLYGEITHVGLRRFLVLITAFLIGTFGAAAFHLGVYTGFIARESRPGLLEFLHVEFATRTTITPWDKRLVWILRISFWCFGGIVAVVFQMADADSLVPIQAFVLGASWPTVVTQLMSGRNTPPPPQRSAIIPNTPGAGGGGAAGGGAGGGAPGGQPGPGGSPPAGTAGEVIT